MPKITKKKSAAKQSAPKVAATPQENIFRSYNALTPEIFDDLLSHLHTVVRKDISEHITVTRSNNRFRRLYEEHNSTRESMEELTTTIGVKGKYGVYSASLNMKNKRIEKSAFTSLYSTHKGFLNLGTVALRPMTTKEYLALLQPEMVKQLKAIKTLADARDFTKTWGTHLVTRVRTGGMLFISISKESESQESIKSIRTKVAASYKKATSLSTTIKRMNNVRKNSATSSVSQQLDVFGGDSHLAAGIDPKDPKTVQAWVKSVTRNTAFAVMDSLEIYTLATGTARKMLKKYIDLTMLVFSLKNPAIFSHAQNIRPGVPCSVATPGRTGSGFKVIGGGSAVTMRSNNFLMGSYPQLSNNQTAGWLSLSKDHRAPAVAGDMLTGYAIAIHDPENYIDVKVEQKKGTRTREGAAFAGVMLPEGWTMTCGGVHSRTISGQHKFVTASYYTNARIWAVASADYKQAANNVDLYAYVIGIKSKDPVLKISSDRQMGSELHGQFGNPHAASKNNVCGGGFRIWNNKGAGNLAQMCSPKTPDVWEGANKDLDGSASPATSAAFAISLRASFEM